MNRLAALVNRLRRAPGYALSLLATLTLGLSLAISMFAIVYGVAFAPLPYPDDEQIVVIAAQRPLSGARGGITAREALQTLGQIPALQAAAYHSWGGADLVTGDRPQSLTLNSVGARFFEVFGVPAALGRTLVAEDIGTPRAVLSHASWQKHFGGDPQIVGKIVNLSWTNAEIVGVMPAQFAYPSAEVALWIAADEAQLNAMDSGMFDNARFMSAVGRLHPDANPQQLAVQLNAGRTSLADSDDWVLGATRILDVAVGTLRPLLLALLGIALLVLLIGCANAAHLVMVRGHARLGSFGVMRALGASRARIATEFLLEIGAISICAVLLALLIAAVGLHSLVGVVDSGLPRASEIGLSAPIVMFALLSMLLVILICGAWPALRLHRNGIQAALARRVGTNVAAGRIERSLPALAIALSLSALSTAGLLAISAQRLATQDALVNVERLLALQLFPGNDDPGKVAAHLELTRHAVEQLPGVEAAALMSGAPFTRVGALSLDIAAAGADAATSLNVQARISSGPVLEVLDIPLQQGRAIGAQDRSDTRKVAMLNQRAALELFKGEDALGRSIAVPPYGAGGKPIAFEVVGIVADRKIDRVDGRAASAEVWMSYQQYPVPFGSLLLDTPLPPKSLIRAAETAVWNVDRSQGIYRSFAPAEERDSQLAAPRFFARNAGIFALCALLLSVVGVYGVLAVDLARRRRELALRAALGANSLHTLRFVARKASEIGVPGLLLGLVLAMAMAQGVRSLLFDAGTTTLMVMAAAAGLPIALLITFICWNLARRAATVPPNVALQES